MEGPLDWYSVVAALVEFRILFVLKFIVFIQINLYIGAQGVLQALSEYGIPVDHVGGTSIGAFIGGLYAKEGDIISSSGRVKQFSSRMGNIWRLLSDVTYPIVAYTTVCTSALCRAPIYIFR